MVGPQQTQAGVFTQARAFGLGLGNTYANEESKDSQSWGPCFLFTRSKKVSMTVRTASPTSRLAGMAQTQQPNHNVFQKEPQGPLTPKQLLLANHC